MFDVDDPEFKNHRIKRQTSYMNTKRLSHDGGTLLATASRYI